MLGTYSVHVVLQDTFSAIEVGFVEGYGQVCCYG